VWRRDPIVQDTFFGKKICGVPGGLPYSQVQRVDKYGNCPSGYEECSRQTNDENTICYPKDKMDQCPINVISFAKNDEIPTVFESRKLNDEWSVIFSHRSDALPVRTGIVSKGFPCFRANQHFEESADTSQKYPLEISEVDSCPEEANTHEKYDLRYNITQPDFKISEFDLQT
jgi:hypothetical protein